MVVLKGNQKAALVWSPAPESAHVSKPSPSSSAGAGGGGGGGAASAGGGGGGGGHNAGSPPTPAPTPGGHALSNSLTANNPPAQGLMHWMSVMAEHMSNPHHDVHYMWNGVESKTVNDQNSGSMQKGGSLDDGRMDGHPHGHGGGGPLGSVSGGLYAGAPRSNSSSSSSPPAAASANSGGMSVVVPQPTKMSGHQLQPSHTNGTGRKYQCKMCPQIFMAKSAMQMHARDAHRSETKPHQCQQCLKSFSSNHQLVQHIRVHTGEKPYRCSYCDRRFKQLSHVQQHTRLHTGERPYRCHVPECGRAFIQLSNLQQHLRNHDAQLERAKNRPFQCAICGKGFATESSLRTHTAKHAALIGGPNTTCCSLCHKLFLGNDALLEHMKHVHKDAAPGPSSMTGESSADNMGGPGSSAASLMMPHQHSLGPPQPGPSLLSQQQGLQPVPSGLGNTADPSAWVVAPSSVKRRAPTHACPVCGKHYVNEGSLRKHLAAHPETAHITSALRMWPCSICPAVFPHETGLLSHMEQMRMEPKHQFAAQYMLSRAAAERRFRDRGESPGPGPSVSSGGAGSSSAGHDDSANQVIDASSGPSPPAPASPVPTGAPQQGLLGHSNRLTSPPGRSPVPQGSMGTHGMAHAQGPMQLGEGMQGTGEMEDEAGGTALTPEEAAVARRLQAAGVEAVLRLAAASATGAGVGVSVGVGVPSASSVSYPDSRLEQAIRLHQALGFALPQPHPLHLHQQQIQFQQHQQHQQHHQQPLQQQQQQQPLHLGQPQHGPQSYHHQANQHHLQHQQPPQGH